MDRKYHSQFLKLPFKAVLIQCLDQDKEPINEACASGCIIKEENGYFLYTCWHVVTGYNPNELKVKNPPDRKFLHVSFQGYGQRQPGIDVIGGLQTITLPLYDDSVPHPFPMWYQDEQDIPHPDLNAINLKIPFWHDAIKLPLPVNLNISDMQVINKENLFMSPTILANPGGKVLVVGYPYGFSALGKGQPTPIVLTRFIAATNIEGRQREFLLESIGAPGMSGGPVFIERNKELKLLGFYTGLLYPDYVVHKSELYTALGTCSNMMLCWENLTLQPQKQKS